MKLWNIPLGKTLQNFIGYFFTECLFVNFTERDEILIEPTQSLRDTQNVIRLLLVTPWNIPLGNLIQYFFTECHCMKLLVKSWQEELGPPFIKKAPSYWYNDSHVLFV